MYEIKHYMDVNTVGTAVLLEALLPPATVPKTRRRLLDEHLRRRPYQTKTGEKIAPKLRPVASSKRASGNCTPIPASR